MSGKDMAKLLNEQYYAFDETDDSTEVGLVITMTAQPKTFYGNIFCSSFNNPDGEAKCNLGRADCRMSASVYNHKVIITKDDHKPLMGLSRNVGIVFNSSMSIETFARCSYVFDGASERRLNVGCGLSATSSDCSKKGETAWDNICPSSGKVCTAEDSEIKNDVCDKFGGSKPVPATKQAYPCVVPGPAFDYHGQDNWEAYTKGSVRDMMKLRIAENDGTGTDGNPNIQEWNEIVLDERLMMPAIWHDPAVVVPAIIYKKDPKNPQYKDEAIATRDEFCKFNRLDQKIPIIAFDMDASIDDKADVFSSEEDDFEEKIIV